MVMVTVYAIFLAVLVPLLLWRIYELSELIPLVVPLPPFVVFVFLCVGIVVLEVVVERKWDAKEDWGDGEGDGDGDGDGDENEDRG